jgi:hypothetical protein
MVNMRPVVHLTGSHSGYLWLTTSEHDLDSLLRLCPQVVTGKYIAVTSLDSGPPNSDEISAGWQSRDKIAYSPRIESVENLAHGECGGFDEWYVFDAPRNLGQSLLATNIFEANLGPGTVAVFVNYGDFGFHTSGAQHFADLFWTQIEWIRPDSYIADGEFLNFVTRDNALFSAVTRELWCGLTS